MAGESWAVLEQRRREQERRKQAAPAGAGSDLVSLTVPRGLAEAFVTEAQEPGASRSTRQLARLLAAGIQGRKR